MSTGNTLKLLRVASGQSQKEIADKLDVSASYVSLIESGEREASLDYLRKFSRTLGVPVSVLLFQTEDPSEPLNDTQQAENERLQELFGNVLTGLVKAKAQQTKKRARKRGDDESASLPEVAHP